MTDLRTVLIISVGGGGTLGLCCIAICLGIVCRVLNDTNNRPRTLLEPRRVRTGRVTYTRIDIPWCAEVSHHSATTTNWISNNLEYLNCEFDISTCRDQ